MGLLGRGLSVGSLRLFRLPFGLSLLRGRLTVLRSGLSMLGFWLRLGVGLGLLGSSLSVLGFRLLGVLGLSVLGLPVLRLAILRLGLSVGSLLSVLDLPEGSLGGLLGGAGELAGIVLQFLSLVVLVAWILRHAKLL
jgi:hypothetical protein